MVITTDHMTIEEISTEFLLRAQRERLPQTRGAFFRINSDNGERSYSALGAIHHYFFFTDPLYDELFKDGNSLPLSYSTNIVKGMLGEELCQYIETLNDSESTGYSFGEIAEKIKNEFH